MRFTSTILLILLLVFYFGTVAGVNIYEQKEGLINESVDSFKVELRNISETQHEKFLELRTNSSHVNTVVGVGSVFLIDLAVESASVGVEYGYENVQTSEGRLKLKLILPLILLYIASMLKGLIIVVIAIISIIAMHLKKITRNKNNKSIKY